MQYYSNGNYESALPLLRDLFYKSGLYYDQYFDVLLKLKNLGEAEKIVKKQLKAYPQNINFKVDYGRLLQEQGEQEKAKAWIKSITEKLPKDETEIRNLATAFYRNGGYDEAVKVLLQGREVLNKETVFTFDLISLYRFQKNKEMLVSEYVNALQHNIEIINQAQNTFAGLFEKPGDYESLKQSLIDALQRNPQNIALTELLLWTYTQTRQYNLALKQTIALDKRLKEDGERVYDYTFTLIENKAFEQAIEALNYLTAKGKENRFYIPAKIQLINIKTGLLEEGNYKPQDLTLLEQDFTALISEFGKSVKTAGAIKQLSHLKGFYLNKAPEAEQLLEDLLKTPGLPEETTGQIKLSLADIYILTGEVWDATLAYSQVEKQFPNTALAQEAKFRNAKLAYFQGDFNWSKAQLDVLKSATSQLIANDALNLGLLIAENLASPQDTLALKAYANADLLTFKNKLIEALSALGEIEKTFAGTSLADDILMAEAKIFLKQKQPEKAATHLKTIADNYAYDLWADDALFMLAELCEHDLKSPEKAKEYYQKLLSNYPGSILINDARKRFRILRGDKTE